MTPFPLDAFFEALANSLWRGALLVGATAAILRFLKRTTAAERHGVWLAVLLVMALAPIVETGAAWSAVDTSATVIERSFIAAPALSADFRSNAEVSRRAWSPISLESTPFLLVWIGISLVLAVQLGRRCWLAWALKRDAAQPEPPLAVAVAEWEARLSARRRAPTRVSERMTSPGAVGWVQPAVLLPRGCEEQLGWEDVELLWRHEQAHVARRDDWTQVLAEAACAALWFHPAVYWVKRQLEQERELACDEAVLDSGVAASSYAGALGRWAEQATLRDVPAGVMGVGRSRSQIVRRIEMLLSPSRIFRPGAVRWSFAAALAAAVGLSAVLVITGPVVVQAQADPEPVVEVEAPIKVAVPVQNAVPVVNSVPIQVEVVVPPRPPVTAIAQAAPTAPQAPATPVAPTAAQAPVAPTPPTITEQQRREMSQAGEHSRRWHEEMQVYLQAIHEEAAKIHQFVNENLAPHREQMHKLAREMSEKHIAAMAPYTKEMAELGAKMAQATTDANREELEKQMEAVSVRMEEMEPKFREIEEQMSQVEVNMEPFQERLRELEKSLAEKQEEFEKAQEALENAFK